MSEKEKPLIPAKNQRLKPTNDGKDCKLIDNDIQDFESEMKKHRIPVLKFDTIDPVDEQLKNMLTRKR